MTSCIHFAGRNCLWIDCRMRFILILFCNWIFLNSCITQAGRLKFMSKDVAELGRLHEVVVSKLSDYLPFSTCVHADKEICCLCSLLSKVNLQTIQSRCLHFCLDYMSVIRWLKRKQITWSRTGRSPFRLVYIRRSFPPPVSNFWRTAHRSLLDSKQPTHTTMPTRRPRRHTDQSKEKLIKYTNNAIA